MHFVRSTALFSLLVVAVSLHAADAPEVKVVSPHRGEVVRYVTLPGTLRANQQVTLYAKVAGYLKSIAVDKGDTVKSGQALAELEIPELLADRLRREADLHIATADVERVHGAQAKAPDLVTSQTVDEAEAKLAVAKASLAQADTLLRYGQMAAPFAGVITMRYVDPGAFVPAATGNSSPAAAAVVTLMDFSVIRAQVAVPETEASRVRVGEPVSISVDGLPGRNFTASVSRQSYALDEATRTLLVEADLPNSDLVLRPGMYASIKVGVEKHTDTLLVPAAALVKEKTANFLFTLANGKAVRNAVKVGFNDNVNVEILEGVAESARVILPGKLTLTPDQAVTEAR
jgi:membrane fusion protein (multidrug efflux system)